MKIRFGDYGMVLVLLALISLFSVLTLKRQSSSGSSAAEDVCEQVREKVSGDEMVLVVGAQNTGSEELAKTVAARLRGQHIGSIRLVTGGPRDLRLALDDLAAAGKKPAVIASGGEAARWRVFEQIPVNYPQFSDYVMVTPGEGIRSDFLKSSNLLAVVERIVVIATIAIGMTMVVLTGGIDLSVGSLIALSAVVGARVVSQMGGPEASGGAVALGFLAGMICCGLFGMVAGGLIARLQVAPFIVTLGIMMMARGLAFMTTGGFSIDQVPDSFVWLAQGRLLGIPNTIILLFVVYTSAHIFMTHTRWGRYIYAVGGNAEAARLSGVPVKLIILLVYTVCGLMAGLGGCLQASQVRAAAPNMANMYELYVIAAIVVGGTSLSGGSGRIFGTLIGAFIIAVIQNGMNLLGIQSYTQMFVLGSVIVIAVIFDQARQRGGIRYLFAAN